MITKFEDKEWYAINGTPCQFDASYNVFFWESFDGTRWFSASSVTKDMNPEHLKNYKK